MFPVNKIGHGLADEIGKAPMSFLVHPVVQAVDHVPHYFETVDHRRGADLHIARTKRHEFRCIAPGRDAADTGDRHARRLAVARDLAHHAQRDRLDRRTAVTAVRALAVHTRAWGHRIKIHSHDRADGIDQRNRIRAAALRSAGRVQDVGDVWRELDDHGQARVLLAPACHHLDVFGDLAYRRTHAAFGHAVRATEIEFDTIGAGVFHHW